MRVGSPRATSFIVDTQRRVGKREDVRKDWCVAGDFANHRSAGALLAFHFALVLVFEALDLAFHRFRIRSGTTTLFTAERQPAEQQRPDPATHGSLMPGWIRVAHGFLLVSGE